MSAPASRYTDAYLCTTHMIHHEVYRPDPPNVFIGGQLPVKLGDLCSCPLGHFSPIAEGASEVLIRGLPAARMGVKSLDGGVVLWGEQTVLIGSETFALPPCITIEGTFDYQAQVLRDLYKIGSTKQGQMLFASLAASGHKVRIHLGKESAVTYTDPKRDVPEGDDFNLPDAYNNKGTDSQIEYNPWDVEHERKEFRTPDGSRDPTLFHELVHADDMAHGRLDNSTCDNPGGLKGKGPPFDEDPCKSGERDATGLPTPAHPNGRPYSENQYRKERGYKERDHWGY